MQNSLTQTAAEAEKELQQLLEQSQIEHKKAQVNCFINLHIS